jgi:hypothetical protein
MRRPRLLVPLLAFAIGAVFAAPASAVWTHDPVNGGVPVSTALGSVVQPAVLGDGAGGAFLAWADYRAGNPQVYVQHLNSYGVAQWPANGIAAGPGAGLQFNPVMDTDGAGGIVLAWSDNRSGNYDIYAQHVTAGGGLGWGPNGLGACTVAGDQTLPSICTDDAGGCYIGWPDARPSLPGAWMTHVYANGSNPYGGNFAFAGGPPTPLVRVTRDGAGGVIGVWQSTTSPVNIVATRDNAAGTAQFSGTNVLVSFGTGDRIAPALCPDGANGTIIAWQDKRTNANGDIYAQRLWFQGALLWTSTGVPIATGTGTHATPQVISDGAGGAFVVWGDLRAGFSGTAAQHLTGAGAALWTANGVTIGAGNASSSGFSAAADGLGGLIVAYLDYHTGGIDTWVQRLNASGVPQWGAAGVAANANPSQDNEVAAFGDGRGGAIVAFDDNRAGSGNPDLFASHVDSWGILGAEPAMASVKDVPNDNGGHVKLSWAASPLEADPASVGVSQYLLFRSAPPNAAALALRAGRVTTSAADVANAPEGSRPLLATPAGANTYYWEYIAGQGAYHLPTYSLVAPTTGDSMGIGNPKTAFMVQALSPTGTQYWTSAPDSGYSVDNVPPIAPAPFTGTYFAGASSLHWNPNPDADLANYRLYRGTSPSFTADAGSLVASPADTGFVDLAGAPYYYKLSAVDIHGNESPVVALLPTGTAGVGGSAAPRELELSAPSPNPARGATRIAFGLPRAGRVRLSVYDAGGRLVRTLADGGREAGAYSLAFDARDERGRALGAGLYLVRLEADGRSLVRRFAVVK